MVMLAAMGMEAGVAVTAEGDGGGGGSGATTAARAAGARVVAAAGGGCGATTAAAATEARDEEGSPKEGPWGPSPIPPSLRPSQV